MATHSTADGSEQSLAWVLTGGLTESGAPTFFDCHQRQWRDVLTKQCVIEERERAERLLAEVGSEEEVVCDAYLIPVVVEAGVIAPTSARERIRAGGAQVVLERLGLAGFASNGAR